MVGSPRGVCFFQKLVNGSTEGECTKLSELEALLAEGDTDDGDAPDNTGEEEAESNAESTKDEPDDIGDGMLTEVAIYSLAEGGKRELSHLEALLTEGNTDDGDAPDDTQEEPCKSHCNTGKDEPKNVADEFHFNVLQIF